MGLAEHLRATEQSEWPTAYADLRQIEIGIAVIDWLEFVIASQQIEQARLETTVVATFLTVMALPEIHAALSRSVTRRTEHFVRQLLGLFAHQAKSDLVLSDPQLADVLLMH